MIEGLPIDDATSMLLYPLFLVFLHSSELFLCTLFHSTLSFYWNLYIQRRRRKHYSARVETVDYCRYDKFGARKCVVCSHLALYVCRDRHPSNSLVFQKINGFRSLLSQVHPGWKTNRVLSLMIRISNTFFLPVHFSSVISRPWTASQPSTTPRLSSPCRSTWPHSSSTTDNAGWASEWVREKKKDEPTRYEREKMCSNVDRVENERGKTLSHKQ